MNRSRVLTLCFAAAALVACGKKDGSQTKPAETTAKATAPVKKAPPKTPVKKPVNTAAATAPPKATAPVEVKGDKKAVPSQSKTKAEASAKTKTASPPSTQGERPAVVAKGDAPKGLEGVWVVDVDGFQTLPEFKVLSEEKRAMALKMLKTMKMEMVFGKDTIALNGEFMGRKKSELTKFKMIKADGKTFHIETMVAGEKKTQVLKVEGDSLSIRVGQKNMVFKRKK